ncbi:hypothetical protein FRB99_007525 [Tulasnella sp. 403]|nr:hypothetical protein FRB99_007525 [Tulasnella sp. 403]
MPTLQATTVPTFASTSSNGDVNSLFEEPTDEHCDMSTLPQGAFPAAKRRLPATPQVDGLHFDPDVTLPENVALDLLQNIKDADLFKGGRINQLMLFERSHAEGQLDDGISLDSDEPRTDSLSVDGNLMPSSSLPPFLVDLIAVLSDLLKDKLSGSTYDLLFPRQSNFSRIPARQAILNLYRPGEGITPHVDLLNRFGDGIIIVSLGSGTVMQLAPVQGDSPPTTMTASTNSRRTDANELPIAGGAEGEGIDLWLEPRSILILERDARYKWTHGIPSRPGDWVEDEILDNEVFGDLPSSSWVPREVRVSITLRWLLPGAEIVGGES